MKKVSAVSNGCEKYEELGDGKGKMYDGTVVGNLEWDCPFCGKHETYGDHYFQNAFQKKCECGNTYIVEYWHKEKPIKEISDELFWVVDEDRICIMVDSERISRETLRGIAMTSDVVFSTSRIDNSPVVIDGKKFTDGFYAVRYNGIVNNHKIEITIEK